MSEMVERVARALCVADGLDSDEDWRISGGFMMGVHLEGISARWTTYERKARAAIAAMREPTEEMYQGVCRLDKMWRDSNSFEIWQAMIDGALADRSDG